MVDGRGPVERRFRAVLRLAERPLARAVEVLRQARVDSSGTLGLDHLEAEVHLVRQVRLDEQLVPLPRPRLSLVTLRLDDEIRPPALVAARVADHVVNALDRRADNPAIEESVGGRHAGIISPAAGSAYGGGEDSTSLGRGD